MIKGLSAANITPMFLDHVAEFGLNYGTAAEFEFRQNIFLANEVEIVEINSNPENTFTAGHNFQSTMTEEELERMRGVKPRPADYEDKEPTVLDVQDIPSSIDWRKEGAVNPVQNQGDCGSCWTFSSTATTEGHWKIQSGNLLKLAEQQLLDCITFHGTGCDGGWEDQGMTYTIDNGQVLERDYPYKAKAGTCQASSLTRAVTGSVVHTVTPKSPSAMIAALVNGPVTVELFSGGPFGKYKRGILNAPHCSTKADHAVAVIGYGESGMQQYVIVRNSWGSHWGERGYISMLMGDAGTVGMCGILNWVHWITMKV